MRITIKYDTEIEPNPLDHARCSNRCQHIEKKKGLYHCNLFDECVDVGKHEDDDKGYGFTRVDKCLNAEGNNNGN